MSLSLAAGAKPAFLSPNYFNRHADKGGDLSVSSGATLDHRLYDNDRLAQWTSSGSSDATLESIVSGIWRPGAQMSHDIDFWAVLNHNIKGLDVYLSNNNGSSYTSVYSSAAVTTDYSRAVLGTTTAADKFKITALAAQTLNAEKLVGAVYLAKFRFQALTQPVVYKPHPYRMRQKSAEMADGSIRSAPKFRSDASFKFWSADVAFYVDTDAELEDFQDLLNDHEPFLFMPRPYDRPNDIWLCRIRPGTFSDAPIHKSQPDIRLVEFVVEEIGQG